jgi:hypothetical protein
MGTIVRLAGLDNAKVVFRPTAAVIAAGAGAPLLPQTGPAAAAPAPFHRRPGMAIGRRFFSFAEPPGTPGTRPRDWYSALPAPLRSRQANQAEDTLVGCALHQHKLHLSEVYGLGRDQAGRIFLKNDGLVFHEGE